jgi:hypothetical protein
MQGGIVLDVHVPSRLLLGVVFVFILLYQPVSQDKFKFWRAKLYTYLLYFPQVAVLTGLSDQMAIT